MLERHETLRSRACAQALVYSSTPLPILMQDAALHTLGAMIRHRYRCHRQRSDSPESSPSLLAWVLAAHLYLDNRTMLSMLTQRPHRTLRYEIGLLCSWRERSQRIVHKN